ncbi:MAG: OB-fold domain-containing protein [Caulobacteraceae bacterium]|nr:OB-fold domain-containing protein [Caulobacteraceae bacterium]
MTSENGILAYGAYIPQRRLQRSAIYAANAWFAPGLRGLSAGEKAVASWDEDSITMAVEAARDCLTGLDRAAVSGVTLASTTLPFADRLNAGVVKEALNLADAVGASDQTGSLRAGTSALAQALAGQSGRLCLGADLRKARAASEAELQQGDAAGAILVGQGEVIAKFLGSYSATVDFVDHFRATGEPFDYTWESRWIRDEGYANLLGGAMAAGLAKLGVSGEAIDRALIPIPVRGVPESLARRCKIRPEAVADTLAACVGDSGTAHPLVMLAAALEAASPGEKILLVGFGQGADLLLFETTEALKRLPKRLGVAGHLARARKDANYMRFLFHRGILDMERGMRAEADEKQPGTALYRNRKAVLGLVGGRSKTTGTVQFPKTEISVSPNARAQGDQEDYPLAEKRARITTYTADSLSYSPDPPVYYGAIDFEGGGRLVAEFADCGPEDVEVGREMRMVFRVKAVDELRDFTKYFWKAVPVTSGEA